DLQVARRNCWCTRLAAHLQRQNLCTRIESSQRRTPIARANSNTRTNASGRRHRRHCDRYRRSSPSTRIVGPAQTQPFCHREQAMKHRTAKEKELADNARLLRAWKRFHRDERDAALSGPHARTLAELFRMFANLKHVQPAQLIGFVGAIDWAAI